jgi:hypothetical protein
VNNKPFYNGWDVKRHNKPKIFKNRVYFIRYILSNIVKKNIHKLRFLEYAFTNGNVSPINISNPPARVFLTGRFSYNTSIMQGKSLPKKSFLIELDVIL